jgi:hypothetical protein
MPVEGAGAGSLPVPYAGGAKKKKKSHHITRKGSENRHAKEQNKSNYFCLVVSAAFSCKNLFLQLNLSRLHDAIRFI